MLKRLIPMIALLLASTCAIAQDDASLLRSFLGKYEGRGVAQYETGGADEVACRIGFDAGSAGKIVLRDTGCNVAGTNIRLSGTLAFLGGQYEAALTSNVGFTGRTIGRREGDSIIYTLEDGQLADRSLGLSATFIMTNGGIVLDMSLISNVSGAITRVRVPMPRI